MDKTHFIQGERHHWFVDRGFGALSSLLLPSPSWITTMFLQPVDIKTVTSLWRSDLETIYIAVEALKAYPALSSISP